MPKVSDAHLDARRRQLLAAARDCFCRRGFHQTTIQEICRAAELSPGALYRYFASKDELIVALCDEELRTNLALIAAAQERGSFALVADELIARYFGGLTGPMPQHGGLDLELWAEAARNESVRTAWQGTIAALRRSFAAIVRVGQSRGEVNAALDAEAAASAALALFYGLLLQKSLDPALPIESYAEVVRSLLLGRFGGPTGLRSHEQPDGHVATATT